MSGYNTLPSGVFIVHSHTKLLSTVLNIRLGAEIERKKKTRQVESL